MVLRVRQSFFVFQEGGPWFVRAINQHSAPYDETKLPFQVRVRTKNNVMRKVTKVVKRAMGSTVHTKNKQNYSIQLLRSFHNLQEQYTERNQCEIRRAKQQESRNTKCHIVNWNSARQRINPHLTLSPPRLINFKFPCGSPEM